MPERGKKEEWGPKRRAAVRKKGSTICRPVKNDEGGVKKFQKINKRQTARERERKNVLGQEKWVKKRKKVRRRRQWVESPAQRGGFLLRRGE